MTRPDIEAMKQRCEAMKTADGRTPYAAILNGKYFDEHDFYLSARQDLPAALAYVEELEGDLAECYRLSGADPDGNENWRLAPRAVGEVRRMREESDAALNLPEGE